MPGKSDTADQEKAVTVTLLKGGNPQIAKGDGEEVVEAYLSSMPGWKQVVGRLLDTIITRTVPDVKKAIRWNSPFYGTEINGWFLSIHCCTRYLKVAFFNGVALDPMPPVPSKNSGVRYFHIYENETLDEELIANWVRQASGLPGWKGFRC